MAGQAEAACPPWGSRGLLAVAILSSCFLLIQAQETPVKVDPSRPLQGRNVTLTPGGDPSFIQCNWYRGARADPNMIFLYAPAFIPPLVSNGPQFTGRETVGPDCSLHISNLTLNDTGIYSVSKTTRDGPQTGSVSMQVFEKVTNITITSHPDLAIEHGNFVLDCSAAGSSVNYTWSKGDQILSSGGHITLGHSNLTFSPASRNDTGNYTCSGINSFSSSNATYQLEVVYGPDEPIINPPKHDYGEGSALALICHADSHPPATYTWSFNQTEHLEMGSQLSRANLSYDQAGNYTCNASNPVTDLSRSTTWEIRVLEMLFSPILSPANSFVKEHTNITLNCYTFPSEGVFVFWFKNEESLPAKSILSERNRTLTLPDISRDDEGTYTCQAWNPANNATSNPSIIVVESTPPPEGPDSGLSAGAIVGIVIGCLVGVVLIVLVLYFALKSTTLGRMEQHSSNGNIPSAPGRNQGVTDTKPTAGEEDIQYTTLAFNSNSPSQPSPGPNIPLESSTIYSVIKKK